MLRGDPTASRRCFRDIIRVRLTVLFMTHDLRMTARICGRVVAMRALFAAVAGAAWDVASPEPRPMMDSYPVALADPRGARWAASGARLHGLGT